MNILHHKSWHVYNTDNIEKVRKDEQKAKEEEEKKTERIATAERETRITLLRQRAEQRQILPANASDLEHDGAHASPPSAVTNVAHINFWEDFEKDAKAANKFAKNPEYEAEKKEADKERERQMSMRLDPNLKGEYLSVFKASIPRFYFAAFSISAAQWHTVISNETQSCRADLVQYCRPIPGIKTKVQKRCEEGRESSVRVYTPRLCAIQSAYLHSLWKFVRTTSRRDEYIKIREDPLTLIKSQLGEKKVKKRHREEYTNGSRAYRSHNQHTDQRKEEEEQQSSSPSSSKSISKLREERLARERAERQRTADLLRDRDPTGATKDADHPQHRGKYNSQFNPDATREAQDRWRGGGGGGGGGGGNGRPGDRDRYRPY
ncbi:hypothetical protein BC938DRAFT_479662 [Jimgerdemannia flammicorona]|uniref:CBF1-interacting co-repressor CIR N-terminal domain-containing protein n=1 Tax=Jimgerdemannia flammicorona TaxID=994334 RepID=A0A433QKD3_9FUNG|nr:hypothetical protein BC938DRAFT_479662 [Jimgerdemannia flammicorona]